jgi:transcriptional regulator with XRE-family HTH domain
MTNLERIWEELSPERRKRINERAAELIAEEMTLQKLRQARRLTQVRMAKALGISQDGVSKLEKRSDLLLSTLSKTIKAMGGRLSLVAQFPDRDPVVLTGIGPVEPDQKRRARARFPPSGIRIPSRKKAATKAAPLLRHAAKRRA